MTSSHQTFHFGRAALILCNGVTVRLDVFAEGAGVGVAFQTAYHFATVGLVHVMRAGVFETVAGVRVAFVAAFIRADVRLFSCM